MSPLHLMLEVLVLLALHLDPVVYGLPPPAIRGATCKPDREGSQSTRLSFCSVSRVVLVDPQSASLHKMQPATFSGSPARRAITHCAGGPPAHVGQEWQDEALLVLLFKVAALGLLAPLAVRGAPSGGPPPESVCSIPRLLSSPTPPSPSGCQGAHDRGAAPFFRGVVGSSKGGLSSPLMPDRAGRCCFRSCLLLFRHATADPAVRDGRAVVICGVAVLSSVGRRRAPWARSSPLGGESTRQQGSS